MQLSLLDIAVKKSGELPETVDSSDRRTLVFVGSKAVVSKNNFFPTHLFSDSKSVSCFYFLFIQPHRVEGTYLCEICVFREKQQ